MSALALEPEKVKPYLKMITEAIVIESANSGLYRRDIWDYLQNKYTKQVDYKDFLISIKRFLMEGKLINDEGKYSMHPEVINEVRVNTPTPALKKSEVIPE